MAPDTMREMGIKAVRRPDGLKTYERVTARSRVDDHVNGRVLLMLLIQLLG